MFHANPDKLGRYLVSCVGKLQYVHVVVLKQKLNCNAQAVKTTNQEQYPLETETYLTQVMQYNCNK